MTICSVLADPAIRTNNRTTAIIAGECVDASHAEEAERGASWCGRRAVLMRMASRQLIKHYLPTDCTSLRPSA